MALLSLAGVATGLADSESNFWSNRRQLIIGGNQASSFEHTHQVAISTKPKLQESTFHCGGSLLAADVVLTAAHCFKDALHCFSDDGGDALVWDRTVSPGSSCHLAWADYHVGVHRYELGHPDAHNEHPECSDTIRVERVTIHNYYDDYTEENDVALLHLAHSAPCVVDGKSGKSDLITLPSRNAKKAEWDNQFAVATGWGDRDEQPSSARGKEFDFPSALHELTLKVLNLKDCRAKYDWGASWTPGARARGTAHPQLSPPLLPPSPQVQAGGPGLARLLRDDLRAISRRADARHRAGRLGRAARAHAVQRAAAADRDCQLGRLDPRLPRRLHARLALRRVDRSTRRRPPAAAAADLGARVAAERARLSALPTPPPQPDEDDPSYASWVPPALRHSLVRACRYDAESAGVCGGGVLCEAHNDVGFLTFDACAATPGLEALRRADGLWVPVEEAAAQPGGELVLIVMVGDTLGYLTKDYYTPCRHRVVRPPDGARIGLPFLFRGRSDAVLNTRPALDAAAAAGRRAHLAEMETTTIKELPAFASAKSILRNWFKSVKA